MRKKIIIFLIGILFFLFFWSGIYLPKSEDKTQKLFLIKKGESAFEIGKNLEKENLIKNRFFFDFYVLATGKIKKLKAGVYYLNPSLSVKEISEKIFRGQTAKIKITIPEGFTLSQIEEKLGVSLSNLKVKDFKKEFNFLESAPDDVSLEGFLFPDTYYFGSQMEPKMIAKIFLKNFDKKLTPKLRKEIERQKKTIYEIVIMASILEKEVKTKEEKELAAGVLWKRLKNKMPLQVDCWPKSYKVLGLPKEPIANPGLDAILSAIYPKNSKYWYYLSLPSGKTLFSKTLKEHNFKKAKYLKNSL